MATQFFGRNQAGEVSANPVAVRFWGGRERGTTWQWQGNVGEGFTASFEDEAGHGFTGAEFVQEAQRCETVETRTEFPAWAQGS